MILIGSPSLPISPLNITTAWNNSFPSRYPGVFNAEWLIASSYNPCKPVATAQTAARTGKQCGDRHADSLLILL